MLPTQRAGWVCVAHAETKVLDDNLTLAKKNNKLSEIAAVTKALGDSGTSKRLIVYGLSGYIHRPRFCASVGSLEPAEAHLRNYLIIASLLAGLVLRLKYRAVFHSAVDGYADFKKGVAFSHLLRTKLLLFNRLLFGGVVTQVLSILRSAWVFVFF